MFEGHTIGRNREFRFNNRALFWIIIVKHFSSRKQHCSLVEQYSRTKLSRGQNQASSDEDDRLRTVHPSTCPCGQRTKILGSDRPSHGQIRTTDQDNNFEMDEWTDFWPWTVHLMDGLGRILWLPKWSLCISIFHDSLELKFYSWFWAFERIFPRRDVIWMVPRKIGRVIEFLSR